MMIRKVGDKVFDMPSQAIQTITRVIRNPWPGADGPVYHVTGPKNPTGDGAFPNRSRNHFEVCDPDKTLPLYY